MSEETQTPGKKPTNPVLKGALTLSLLAVTLGVLYYIPGPLRAVDVYYKAGWMVSHWGDEKSFPSGSNVCTYLFCTRTDTVPKYVGGKREYTSQVTYNYCSIHEPEFISMGNRLDGFLYFVYWGWSFFCSFALGSLILFILFWPISKIFHRVIPTKSSAPEGSPQNKKAISEGLQFAVMYAAFGFALISWLMFAWW